MKPTETAPRYAVPLLVAALLAALFAVDLLTPLGYADWALHLLPVAATLLQRGTALPLLTAGAATLLMAIGYFASPVGAEPVMAAVNRTIGGVAVWALAITVVQVLATRRRVQGLLWLQQRQNAVGQALLGEQTADSIGERATAALCDALGAQVGAAYRLEGGALLRSGVHAVDAARVAARWELAAGLPGEVAASGRARWVGDVPAGHLPIASALGASAPRHLLVAPLTADGKVAGVVELGFAGRDVDAGRAQALLQAVGETIGVALRTAVYRERLAALLEETQRQAEELQTQQEELRVSNEELEEQSRVLTHSQAQLEAQQAELEQTNSHLEEQTHALERQKAELLRAQEQLEAASRYKSEFLANMSHELRTPLNSALILSKLLADNKEETLTAEQVRYAQTIHASNSDLLALINDVLDLSKIEAGRVDLAVETVDVATLLDRMRAAFEPMARQKSLAFAVTAGAGAPASIDTDPMRLQQVLKNLLANAVKFTERGEVALAVRGLPGERVAFDVRDTGLGIAKAQQEVVFEAFRQADGSTSRRHGGTGLGLSISRELARRLGGDIRVDSEPGRGSVFTLDLPRVCVPQADADTASARGEPFGGTKERLAEPGPATSVRAEPVEPPAQGFDRLGPNGLARPVVAASHSPAAPIPAGPPDDRDERHHPGRLVLAVEDDVGFARALVALAHEQGFDCVVATSGAEALQLARELQPDGILLDVGLPDQSGLGVLERLKRDPATRHVPVHMISAYERLQTAFELGAVGYLRKPATREQLTQVFERLQQRLQQKLRRLLLVEDDASLRENLKLLLGGEQVEITGVGTIAEALQQLHDHSYDCMVTDLALPDGTGYELLERIAGSEQYAFPPVIVYTGRALGRDEEQRLRRYSKSIIVKGARSPERLLDEVTLFLHSVEASLPANQRTLLERARRRDAVLDGRRILLAEDDVRNIFALTSVFEPLGAKLEIARNGREALERLAARDDIDLVLMDIMMPEMDGLAAMRAIRADARWADLPLIALTAKAMPDDRERCLEAGANDYIAKPIDVDKLVSLCRVWMPK